MTTAPAEDRHAAHVGGRGRDGGSASFQRNQGDHRTVDAGGGSEALYRHCDLAVDVRGNGRYVLRGTASLCGFATPVVDPRRAGGALVDLGNRGAACARSQDHFGYLRPVAVVLVRRKRYCGQNADDRNYDHQLDQREASMDSFHVLPLSLSAGRAALFEV